ncbi:trigger factor [Novosphingobium nitrogenifigens DSM 19370]|uniref:Trigger factor n=1 Tax=Novosphingobium nitrogenifigens DSM 19370 TaxID=983920 RepID=F1Z7K0_9SPHN|nr:trigger factor [Novosphingobium nitrogenifigens]EGD59391.1 trigger factor [Novosphingobium nitrogenifigens DSM 19370]
MQIVETSNEGLKRAYTVTITATDIAARIEGEVKKIAPQVRMPGFRPGKVPTNLVRKLHGPSLHQEALQTTIRAALDQLVADHALRPATQPAVSLGEGYEEGKDAELTISLEVLPVIETPSTEGLKLEKLVVPVSDAEVDEAVARIGANQKNFADAGEDAVAKDGDQLIIDFVGKLDGEPFEGGSAEDAPLELGSARFIPGFEEQLVGVKAGEEKTITVTFPEDYPAEQLKGKAATFDITVKQVKVPGEFVANDDFAKQLGLEGIDQLRGLIRGQLEQETAGLTRTQMKRQLLDVLAAGHDFPVPDSMVDAEFEQIWQQLTHEASHEENPEEALKEIEAEKDDYRRIAERRVRLGLLLSEIGQANGVVVTAQEMEMLIRQAAQQYREQDRQRFVEYIRSEPLAAAQLRAPLYEDKVVDFLFDKAEVAEREVTRDELQAAIEADENGEAPAKAEGEEAAAPKKKATRKKAAAEETPAGEAGEATEEAAPKKKATRKKAAAAEEPAAE